jgi:PAS domain S-box-containing protein
MLWLYATGHAVAHQQAVTQLEAIADIKAWQVTQWRNERLREGRELANRDALMERLASFIDSGDSLLSPTLATDFTLVFESNDLAELILADASGRVLHAAAGRERLLPEEAGLLTTVLRERNVACSDFLLTPEADAPHIAVIVPVQGEDGLPIGALFLASDMKQENFPLLAGWPVPSATAEFLLFRREGNDLLVLSPMRHRTAPPMSQRLPLSDTRIPAVRGILGERGVLEGVDYRGVEVIAAVLPVEDTPWLLSAEVDHAEIMAQWRGQGALLLALLAALLALPAMGVALATQSRRRQDAEARLSAERDAVRLGRLHSMLSHTNQHILRAGSKQDVLDGVCEVAVAHGGFLFAWIGQADEKGGLRALARAGNDAGYIEFVEQLSAEISARGDGPPCAALSTGSTLVLNRFMDHPDTVPWRRAAQRSGVGSAAALPVRRIEDDRYALYLYAAEAEFFSAEEISTLEAMADDVAFALRNVVQAATLRDREAQFRVLFEQSPVPIFIHDKETGTILDANAAAIASLGLPDLAALSHNDFWLPAPYSFGDALVWIRKAAAEGAQRFEWVSRKADGELMCLAMHLSAITLEGMQRVIAISVDITDLKRAEETMRLQSACLAAAANAIMITDVEGRIQWTNPAFTAMTGYTLEECLGRNPRDLVRSGTHGHELYAGLWKTITSGGTWRGELVNRRKDGSLYNEEIAITPVRGEDGRITHFVSVTQDITERIQFEQTLVESQAKLERAVAAGGIALWDWQATEDRLEVSDEWVRMLGVGRSELAGTLEDFTKRLHPDDLRKITALQSALDTTDESTFSQEFRLMHADGAYRCFFGTGTVTRNEQGLTVRVSGANVEITARKQLEEEFRQAQKMESIGRLAGGVAHDFNNLLSVIGGYTEMALDTVPEEDPLQHDLKQVKHAADRAANLTRQLLAFSRRQVLHPEITNLNSIVTEAEKMLRRLVGEDIAFSLQLEPKLGQVLADPGQMEQVLMNLAVNARDAMPEGGTLAIETRNLTVTKGSAGLHPDVLPGRYVTISVRDSGMGMDEATREQIFDPFFTTKESGKGTGLGLATVYGIVKQSGGSIRVESEPSRGAVFTILLPRVDAPEPYVNEATRPRPESGSGTILVVEDEESLRDVVKRMLSGLGYTVLLAQSGTAALELLDSQGAAVDLLVTDVIMPGMSGARLAEAVEARYPGTPVLFISGYTDEALAHHGVLDAGIRLLNKPFTAIELATQVRDALKAARRP